MEFFLFFFLFLFLSPAFTAARDTIAPGSPLLANQTLVSAGGTFALGFFSPDPAATANRYVGVRFNTVSDPTYVWVANRDRAVTGSNATLTVAANGTLSLTDGVSVAWSVSSTSPLTSAVAQLLDTGNLVIRESSATIADDTNPDGAAEWQSFWHPTDTMLADMKFGVNRTTGLNTTVTSWKSDTDPSSGAYQVYMDLTSDPQVFVVSGSRKIWRSGPADGVYYSPTVPADLHEFTYSWKFDADAAVFSYHIADSSILMMIKINSTGVVQLWLWGPAPGWVLMDYAPKDICDFTSACGPNSVCNATKYASYTAEACSCLLGFSPANAADWAVGQYAQGCVRAFPPECSANGTTTDTVVKLGNAKAPDTTGTATNTSRGLDDCKKACLANCSCTAYAATNLSVGAVSGCVMWFGDLADLRTFSGYGGQDVYVRTALAAVAAGTPQAPNGSAGAPPVALIASLSAVGLLLLLAAAGYFIWRRSKTTIAKNVFIPGLGGDDFANEDDDVDFPLLDLEAVAIATDNFSPANKLGQGGFGPVYKGKLPDGQEIAVKRNAKTSSQGTDEFMNEVRLIAKLQHRNLVRLIGCSLHGEERMLVYEYMPNKSLDLVIFDQARSVLLNWTARYHIIEGIAKGLLYLHEDSRLKIIHRDLKASNILLDKDMNPKISDFGIARIFNDEDEINTRRVVGTYGYMSPEYALEGAFSVKSDVFSFGILMLEIISGRKNRGGHFTNDLSLVDYAWRLWKQDKILKLVDDSMDCSYPTEDVVKCIKLALLCVQEMPEDRPVMSYVVSMLSHDAAALPEPKKSGYTAMRGYHFNSDSSTSKSVEVDTAPITVLDAR